MGYIREIFLGKEYSIPEDVLIYIDLLDFAEDVKKQLVNAFVRKLNIEIKNGNTACLDDKDLSAEIEQQIGRFIAKLCDNGIFNRTISDYLKNNKGYQLFSDVNKAALEKMRSLLIREMDSWQAGFEDALQKKESSVTGMGFSIWSSSFINHAIYAAMEASTVDKQEKAAVVQYQKDMNELRARLDSQYGGEKSIYVHNTYIPNMESALTVFAYELLDKYLADLIANGKFDSKTLDFVDISRSNELLKNLTLSNNKKAIIENAFVACPYNIAVYMQAMKYDLLDYDSFQTAKVFKQSAVILSFLQNNWGQVSYPTAFSIDYHCIELLALFSDTTPTELLRSRTEKYVTEIVNAYAELTSLISDTKACRKVIRKHDDKEILTGDTLARTTARSLVGRIVRPEIWDKLMFTCGHSDLQERIVKSIPGNVELHSKNELDTYLTEQLAQNFEKARQELSEQIKARQDEEEKLRIEREQEKAEQARIQAEKKAQKTAFRKKALKRVLITVGGIVAAFFLLIIAVAVYLGVTNKPIDNDFDKRTEYSVQNLTYEVPSNWILDVEQSTDNLKFHVRYDNWGNYLCVMAVQYRGEIPAVSVEDIVANHISDYNDAVTERKNIGDQVFSAITYTRENDNNCCNVYVTEKDSSVFMIYFRSVPESNKPLVFEEMVAAIDFDNYVSPSESKYRNCLELIATEKYTEAIGLLTELGEYKDSLQQMSIAKYGYACELLQNGSYSESIQLLTELGAYEDCAEKLVEAQYEYANLLMSDKKYIEARALFLKISEYKDAASKIEELDIAIYKQEQLDIYNSAISFAKASDFQSALDKLNTLQEPIQDSEELKEQYQTILSFVGVWTVVELKDTNGYDSAGRRFHKALIAKYKGNKVYFYFGLVAEYLEDGTVKANISEDMAYELQGNKLVYVGERNLMQKPEFWLEGDVLVQYSPEATATNGYHVDAETEKYVRVKQ